MDSSPKELEPYLRAHMLKMEREDEMAWSFCGAYVRSAVAVAVEHCLNGKKAKSEYIKEPILKNSDKPVEEMSEEELRIQRELFVAKLQAMKANFDLNHKKPEKEGVHEDENS